MLGNREPWPSGGSTISRPTGRQRTVATSGRPRPIPTVHVTPVSDDNLARCQDGDVIFSYAFGRISQIGRRLRFG